MKRKIFRNKKGMTLVEILVSVSIFSLIMLSALGIFNFVLEDQRNSISSQDIQEGVRYALEMMAKEIRTAAQSNTDCYASGTKRVFNSPAPQELYFKNKYGACVVYSLSGDRIQITRDGVNGFLTGSKVKVSNLRFDVVDNDIGAAPGSRLQPRVTISMDLETTIGRTAYGNRIKIQTSVSSRLYE